MREHLIKKLNHYWVWDYGSVVVFELEKYDEDGNLHEVPKEVCFYHIGRDELEEYIEVLQYALDKRKKYEIQQSVRERKED